MIEAGKPMWTIGRHFPRRKPWPAHLENDPEVLSITTTESERWCSEPLGFLDSPGVRSASVREISGPNLEGHGGSMDRQ